MSDDEHTLATIHQLWFMGRVYQLALYLKLLPQKRYRYMTKATLQRTSSMHEILPECLESTPDPKCFTTERKKERNCRRRRHKCVCV